MTNQRGSLYQGPSTRWLLYDGKWYFSGLKLSDNTERTYWTSFYLRQKHDLPRILPKRMDEGDYINASNEWRKEDEFSRSKREKAGMK